MPFIPVPNGVQAEMRYTQDGQKVENVFWFIRDDAVDPETSAQDIATFLLDWWNNSIKTLQASAVSLREIYVTDQSAANGFAYTLTAGLPAAGANVNEPLPNGVTACVSLRTALRGRSYRGRSYFIGLTENNVLGNTLGAQFVTALLAAYDSLVTDSTLNGYPLAVCSRFSGGNPRPSGILTQVRDALLIDSVVDSQRRRLPGRGA